MEKKIVTLKGPFIRVEGNSESLSKSEEGSGGK